MQVISATLNGKVYRCPSCSKYHIEYKNLNFNLSPAEYQKLVLYFAGFDGDLWEDVNRDSIFRRKIIIPTGNKRMNILINSSELKELKTLFGRRKFENDRKETILSLCEMLSEEQKIFN